MEEDTTASLAPRPPHRTLYPRRLLTRAVLAGALGGLLLAVSSPALGGPLFNSADCATLTPGTTAFFCFDQASQTLREWGGGQWSILPLVNARDFGAIGNGTTDDTDAVTQAVIAAAAAHSVLVFPATQQSYNLARSFDPKGVTFVLLGATLTGAGAPTANVVTVGKNGNLTTGGTLTATTLQGSLTLTTPLGGASGGTNAANTGFTLGNGTSAPASPVSGASLWFNPTLNTLNGYDGTGWQSDTALTTKILNVKDPRWGAKGDGTTDDTAAFQAAHDSLASTAGFPPALTVGGVIYVPKGRYKLASQFTISKDGVQLVGAGRGATILDVYGQTGIQIGSGTGGAAGRTYGVTIRDLTINANGSTEQQAVLIHNGGATGASTAAEAVSFTRVEWRTTSVLTVDGVLVEEGSTAIRFKDIYMLPGFRDGIRIQGGAGSDTINNVWIDGAEILQPTRYAVGATQMLGLSILNSALVVGGVPATPAARAIYLNGVNVAFVAGTLLRHNNGQTFPVEITSNAQWNTNNVTFAGDYFDVDNSVSGGGVTIDPPVGQSVRDVAFLHDVLVDQSVPTGTNQTVQVSGAGTVSGITNEGSTNFSINTPGAIAPRFVPAGTSRLTLVSATQIQLGLGVIPLRVLGEWIPRAVTAAVTVSNAGLASNTLYFVYAYDNAGTTTLELSTTGHATDTVLGVETKSTDATRTLVGQVRTQGSVPGQFVDSQTQRFVLSWFRQPKMTGFNGFTVNRTTASLTYVELNSEIRIEFLVWPTSVVNVGGMLRVSNDTLADVVNSAIGFDGTTAEDGNAYVTSPLAGTQFFEGLSIAKSGLAEGYHFVTLLGLVTAGTGTWFGGAAGAGSNRCTISMSITPAGN